MDFTMMQAAGRLIEERTREQLRLDWELAEKNTSWMVGLWTDTQALLGRIAVRLHASLETGKMRERHA